MKTINKTTYMSTDKENPTDLREQWRSKEDNFQWTDELVAEYLGCHITVTMEWFKRFHLECQEKKAKPILFTCVDGIGIKHGDKFYSVTDDFEVVYSDAVNGMHLIPQIISRSYSTESAANLYILEHKPLLSLADIARTECFSDITYKKLKELAQQKINTK